ncbi:hypothetical protein ACCS54_10895 [Rhizobium johnstonii]|uniref:Uncharacterized protein n=1 Tax=Rhizobium leguminosarum bv. viciae TaxID=387 RepID=A0A8I2GP12_RHILV|nr:hypothetical protein [Rhizobium leguminosarum]MBB4508645.1 hypothetical protein [Rhizobium leguminosarum]MBY5340816.1 hypothetical protein [Rhizobium leguminosarum]MBY5426737.1 hypothetical protein [Rhizobium leguminosarum]MBY5796022.1 hypothetical protein [Rhizobium leguminosarum]MBY5822242.1 hypothetical protein [Rhizobium leguminosarum]
MCSLCGILGGNEHWADAVARPGVYTRTAERIDRRRERARRVAIANRILDAFGLGISDWQGSSFLLSTRTGKTEIIEDLGHLWPAAERLAGRPLDPLAEPLLDRLEANRHG